MNIEDSIIILKNIKKLVDIEWKHYVTDAELSAIETLLTAYEKEKNKNKKARDMIEYYLIENNSLNDFDKRNKELRKLEKILEE